MSAIIGAMLTPSGLAYSLFVLGLLTCFKVQWRRLSWGLLAASGAITVVCSSGTVATALISPLEYEYPAVHNARHFPDVKDIVVLTGYAADDPDMPVTGRLHYASAFRVMMALQLQQQCPDCDVIVSGDPVTARVMGEALLSLGLPEDSLELETASRNTAASAVNLQPLLREPFFLITSAGHQHRSVAVLKKQGLQPIPVPTDYQGPTDWRKAELRPSPQSLFTSDLAVHEYVGRLWYRLKGAI
jgi:uncharacterized SAM-binding protein YcdF (DUF218 family)